RVVCNFSTSSGRKQDMEGQQFVALLRGINVGGNNIIKMADLKSCFEGMGFTGVSTYIQSGNVIFSSVERDKAKLTRKIETVLSDRFSYKSQLVLVTYRELEAIVAGAPSGFGKFPGEYKYDVMFLREGLSASDLLRQIPLTAGVDQVWNGAGVIYFSRLGNKSSQSRMSKIITMPFYREITIRNWNTATKLLNF
ncbi:MAG: DUF1697 domain-containing protein, partial [Bacteroidales bacterium]